MELGEAIRRFRKARGLKVWVLASSIYVHESAVRHWEKGRRIPSAAEIVRIAQIYEVSADYLLGLSDRPEGGIKRGKKAKSAV